MKIRKRLTLASLVCLIPMWIGIIVIALVGRTSDREKAKSLMREYVQEVSQGVEAFFYDARSAAAVLANMHGKGLLAWQDGGKQFFESMIHIYPTLNNISLAVEDGTFYTTDNPGNPWQGGRMTMDNSNPAAEPLSSAGSEFYITLVTQNARGEERFFMGEPEFPPDLNAKAVITSAAVIHEGRAVGTVNAVQTLKELDPLYAEITANFRESFGERAHLYLVSRGGQLVSSLGYNPASRSYEDALFGSMELVPISTLGDNLASIIESSIANNNPITEARLGGTAYFIAASTIGDTPYTVCITVPASDMLQASRVMLVTAAILSIIMAVMMIGSMGVITRPIILSLKAMERTMQEIAEGGGDLTVRIDVRGNDEIAEISEHFNRFVSSLHGMIESVSKNAAAMENVGLKLANSTEEISVDTETISKDIGDMNFAVEEQSASVTETSATITQIAQNIESLTGKIESQSSAVTQSSASVSQMVSNIAAISENISKAAGSFDKLKSNAGSGKVSINNVQELVNKLSAQSDSLLEANSVIDNIAAQTNLLAMNAAIEAAHAGESGKGFSVVAEEIRKLSQNSASQSKTIAAGLKNTISLIKSIASATAIADGAFDSVSEQIGSLTQLVNAIDLAMSEQNEGSRQVLEALREIENVTMQIRDGAVEMNGGTATILKEITRLSEVSQAVATSSASIGKAAGEIHRAVLQIAENTGANKDAVSALTGITGKFVL